MPEYEFGTRESAQEARSIAFRWLNHEETDWRTRKVVTKWNCPEDVTWLLEWREHISNLEERKYGQAKLTAGEKSRIDFRRSNLFHAQSCKAIAQAHGESDWIAKYDHTLTPHEHIEVYAGEEPRAHPYRI